ncbi:MAG: phospholipase D-like domain-containing protein [Flavobacteriales bacterium]
MFDLFRSSILLLTFCAAQTLVAQIPIAQARDLTIGTTVTVRGIVTNGSELGGIRYMQDGTGGIAVFPGTGSTSGFSPTRGTDISVTGPLKLFNGLLEIDPVQSFTVHATNVPLPAAQTITPAGMGETTESELVRINACVFANAGSTFTSGTTSFTSNGLPGNIFLRTGHPLVGNTIPAGIVDIIGLVSQFSTATPPIGGYQLLPRTAPDLIASNSITILGEVLQSSIVPTGFTLDWNTNIAGSARVRYGLTPAMSSLASPTAISTSHSAQVSGLLPARAYYAQAYSVQGADTAWAPVQLYSTASADAGSVRVYFNKPVDENVAIGPVAIDLGSAMDDTLKAYMDRAESTLDIAVYNTTSSLLVNAANDARSRGVQVRWIAEASNSNSALQNLSASIPLLYRTNSTGSGMHNKFVIVDADGGPAAHILTGSANFTNSGLFLDPNNLVVVNDMALARAYRMEFEEMWGSSGTLPNLGNSRFGGDKTNNTPHLFNVGGTLVQSWFSPSDGTTARIVDALQSADERIEFALFVLTSSTLTEALIDMHAEPGVVVRGMVEEEDMSMWTFDALLEGGVDVRTDGATNSLHHKYAIVDRGAPDSDPMVVTGSHNWSFNAENNNDENTLIIHSATIADQFHQEWNARWTTAVSVPELGATQSPVQLWPNPSNTVLNIALESMAGNAELYVVDASGRIVHSERVPAAVHVLDVQSLSPGAYSVVVVRNGERYSRTFLRMP